jgi:hypothetical protein
MSDLSPTAWVAPFRGRDQVFDLTIGGAASVERAAGIYLGEVFTRLAFGSWSVACIIEPIRHGLIGGGMPDAEIAAIMREIERGPIGQHVQLAADIVNAFVSGREAVLAAKKDAAAGPADPAPLQSPAI